MTSSDGRDQDRCALERGPESLCVALEAGLQRQWGMQFFFDRLDSLTA